VLAGLDVALEVFRQLDPDVSCEAHRRDGDWCEPGSEVAWLAGGPRRSCRPNARP
jgi:nicotinate-nucleotide pyrophosphorylase